MKESHKVILVTHGVSRYYILSPSADNSQESFLTMYSLHAMCAANGVSVSSSMMSMKSAEELDCVLIKKKLVTRQAAQTFYALKCYTL